MPIHRAANSVTTTKIDIIVSTDARYLVGAIVSLAGIALNAKQDTELVFHVFIPPTGWDKPVNGVTLEFLHTTLRRLHAKSRIIQHVCDELLLSRLPSYAQSKMAAVRCFYATLLPSVDWALYVDCDILYLASPEAHFALADDSSYVCASLDGNPDAPRIDAQWAKDEMGINLQTNKYFCSGVMLMNLKKFRENNIPNRLSEFFLRHPQTTHADQTALNVLFNGRNVTIIPPKYDLFHFLLDDRTLMDRPVVHYVVGAPWLSRLSIVANGSFFLWHAFADKYVWQHKGGIHRLVPWRRLAIKRLIFLLLKTPILHEIFTWALSKMTSGFDCRAWGRAQAQCKVSKRGIQQVLNALPPAR